MEIIRELGKSYLIIEDRTGNEDVYQRKMITDNHIKNIPECRISLNNNTGVLRYDITNMRSIKRIYSEKRMSFEDLCELVSQIADVFAYMSSYLMDETRFIMNPEYLYRDMETETLKLIYVPFDVDKAVSSGFSELSDFFLDKIDHKNEHAVNIAYQFYKMSKEPLFSLIGFCSLIEKEQLSCSLQEDESERAIDQNVSPIVFEDDYMSEINESEDAGNSSITRVSWISSLIAAIVGILLYAAYIILKGVTIYASYLILLSILAGIICVGLSVRNIVLIVLTRKEDSIEIPREPVTIDDYWGKGEAESPKSINTSTEAFEDEETTFFDIEVKKTIHYIRWTEESIDYNKEIASYPFVIGKKREEVDCYISDSSISRQHASIDERFGKLYLKDLNSTNGVFVNGSRIKPDEEVEIAENDEIYFGKVPVTVV